ncbi:hypothetical protein [Marivita hallyeonensis]|uniref:Uncharacterized protein n=1 Tax=Marivita hallyeonensis TaxID=996342 RepID=A0A1M5MYX6_9RHOB|nr:hypothetical protein [Marivita hallyeonensis]SHG82332.1 hypothetical protein SAMN05443551_0704 [Marivita hallyeonensis]
MEHLKPFKEREVLRIESVNTQGWQLKRYAILADGRAFDAEVAAAATDETLKRLPKAGSLTDTAGNHGIGFQIIHFAETAVVSPVFYWQWGSVLAQPFQIKAHWDEPTVFKDGVDEIVGCIWEMNIVRDEVTAWTETMLGRSQNRLAQVSDYLNFGL